MKSNKPEFTLDLKGIPCPQNTSKALLKLALMEKGDVLEIIIDDGEPKENVPSSIVDDSNYKLLRMEKDENSCWHLFVEIIN
jgi:tRNA 2-thiouridine synthesizing protein A